MSTAPGTGTHTENQNQNQHPKIGAPTVKDITQHDLYPDPDVEAGLIAPTAYRTIFTTPTAGMAELAALARSSYCELAIADPVLAKVLVTPRVSVGPLMLARLRMYAREAGAPEPAVTVVAVALLEAEAAARRGLAAVVDALMLGVAPRRVLVVGTDAECAAVISAGELAAFFAPREWWA